MSFMTKIGWPPKSKKDSDTELPQNAIQEEMTGDLAVEPKQAKKIEHAIPSINTRELFEPYQIQIVQRQIQKETPFKPSELQKLLIESYVAKVKESISKKKLDSGPISRSLETANKYWDKMNPFAQFMLSHTLATGTALITSDYLNLSATAGNIGARIAIRSGLAAGLKVVFETIATDIASSKPEFHPIYGSLFSRKAPGVAQNENSNQAQSFNQENTDTTTQPSSFTGEAGHDNTTATEQPSFDGQDASITMRPEGLDSNISMSDNESNTATNEPQTFEEKNVNTTADKSLSETLEYTLATAVKKQEERKSILKKLLPIKELLVGASVGVTAYFAGPIMAAVVGGGYVTREIADYMLKEQIKALEERLKTLGKEKISLTPTLNEENQMILDPNVLRDEFEAIREEVTLIVEAIAKKENLRSTIKAAGRISTTLGTEAVLGFDLASGALTGVQNDVLLGSVDSAGKRAGKAAGKGEKMVRKEKKEIRKSLEKASYEELFKLKVEYTDKLDDAEYELYNAKQDLAELSENDPENKASLEKVIAELSTKVTEAKEELSLIKDAREKLDRFNLSPLELQELEEKERKIQQLKNQREGLKSVIGLCQKDLKVVDTDIKNTKEKLNELSLHNIRTGLLEVQEANQIKKTKLEAELLEFENRYKKIIENLSYVKLTDKEAQDLRVKETQMTKIREMEESLNSIIEMSTERLNRVNDSLETLSQMSGLLTKEQIQTQKADLENKKLSIEQELSVSKIRLNDLHNEYLNLEELSPAEQRKKEEKRLKKERMTAKRVAEKRKLEKTSSPKEESDLDTLYVSPNIGEEDSEGEQKAA